MRHLKELDKALLRLLNVVSPESAKEVKNNINYGKKLEKAIIRHVELSGKYGLVTASGMIEELEQVGLKVDELLAQARIEVAEYLLGSSEPSEPSDNSKEPEGVEGSKGWNSYTWSNEIRRYEYNLTPEQLGDLLKNGIPW